MWFLSRSTEGIKGEGENTYMTIDDMQKHVKPMARCAGRVCQKFSLSKSTLSDTSVIMHERSKISHPEGKHRKRENEGETCSISYKHAFN